jgi:predicted amidohydrolase
MERFTVACCQIRAHGVDEAERNLEAMLAAIDEAGAAGARLIALPECSYPAYYLRDDRPYDRPGVRPFDEVARLLGERAQRHGAWIVAGLAMPHADGSLTNSGVVFAPDGEIAGHYDKTLLWHFDRDWFRAGDRYPVWDAGFCRFGVLICADSRQPEIARSLAVNGAEVIVDLTAWVASGATVAELDTTQCHYVMPARAYENGAWVVCADKWGTEDGTIAYGGRSTVIDPLGNTRVCAPSDRDAVVLYEIEPEATSLVPRRPELYGTLTEPVESLPVARLVEEPLTAAEAERRVVVAPIGDWFDSEQVVAAYTAHRRQDTDLVVFGGMRGPEGWQAALHVIENCVRHLGGSLVLTVDSGGCAVHRATVAVTPEQTVEHLATHGRGIQPGNRPAPVVGTPAGRVGLLCDEEGEVPEVARALALQGAEILAWGVVHERPMTERLARVRSDENRVYTAVAWPESGRIIAPWGGVVLAVPAGAGVGLGEQVNRLMARSKRRAPGTDVMADRVPHAYGALLERRTVAGETRPVAATR